MRNCCDARWLIVVLVVLVSIIGVGVSNSIADYIQTKKLLPFDPGEQDAFGRSVAIDGDTAVVGAYHDDIGNNNYAGSAYVFERDSGGSEAWGQVRKLVAADAAGGDEYGTSVAISGDTIVIGAQDADSDDGAAYIYQRDQGGTGNWGQVKKITASDGANNDAFGDAVAIDGDIIVVGAPYDDDTHDTSGSAYVFYRDQGGAGNWGQVRKLNASDPGYFGTFGKSVAVSGNTVIVGAPLHDAPANGSGAAYLFARDQGGDDNWGQADRVVASDATLNANFGYVAISGDTAIVGAPYAEQAYVFVRDGGGDWNEQKILVPTGGGTSINFGFSVSIDGDNVVVGAYTDAVSSYSGAAYLFARNIDGADNWGQISRFYPDDPAAGDRFGYSVAVSGATSVIGADGNDDSYSDAGSAYVFKEGVLGDVDGSGAVDLTDAILITQILAGMAPSQAVSAAVEIDDDGRLGAAEVLYVLRIVGLP